MIPTDMRTAWIVAVIAFALPALASPQDPHWAFRPVRAAAPPAVGDVDWPRTAIDRFVLAKLEASGLQPRAPADKRTLLRRATFDLVGLPPTAQEVDAFLADGSPHAFELVVDRLLASPHYGERWARHWLDVARYADTKGYVFQEDRRLPFAYTYRDWVIAALNDDLPYDEFLVQQIAADRLELGEDKRALAAMGFLTVGRRFLNNRDDIIDDRIDVVTRGTMALTVRCARCHDHKFDPIPTADYYSLHGVFASSREPKELPVIGVGPDADATTAYYVELEARQQGVARLQEKLRAALVVELRKPETIARALHAAFRRHRFGEEPDKNPGVARTAFERWRTLLDTTRASSHAVLQPFHAFAALDGDFATAAAAVAARVAAHSDEFAAVDPAVAELFAEPPTSMREVCERYGDACVREGARYAGLQKLLSGKGAPGDLAIRDLNKLLSIEQKARVRELKSKVSDLRASHPGAPLHAMVLEDRPRPADSAIYRRGNRHDRGDVVPRRFLAAVAGDEREPFRSGSGRLELAHAIASPRNPLTARVLVNRVWMHHFGRGLVTTPSDFGVRGDAPSHPELLDWLAAEFVEGGWSLKQLHRLVLTSRVYQQRSDHDETAANVDPDNRLLWRANRRRLDFEQLRDAMLRVGGGLDATFGGRPVPLLANAQSRTRQVAETIDYQPGPPSWNVYSDRRSIYLLIDRQNLPATFRAFDFANPDAHCARRHQTTVPQRALFLLNSAFVATQARRLAALPEVAAHEGPEFRVQALYRRAFGRAATTREVRAGVEFVQAEVRAAAVATKPVPTWRYGVARFDERAGAVRDFVDLPHFTGTAWQGGGKLPDPKIGWVTLNALGGHPGGPGRDAVRRWTAPREGVADIVGMLEHQSDQGDGVVARIVSSRHGLLSTTRARHGRSETRASKVEVRRGDTIDFVLSCGSNEHYDAFAWAPAVQMATARWRASTDFAGPPGPASQPLSPWAKYAQVLLMTNEFAFVD